MAFFNKYPYTDDHQLNLDWVIQQIQKIRSASGVTYDDDITQLGADNVQTAIEKLNDEIAAVAQMSSAFILIENAIAITRWQNGYSYSHLQTVNDATLVAICDAVRNNKLIVFKFPDGDSVEYFYEVDVTEIPGDYQHVVSLYDPFGLVKLSLVINGLNDAQNIFCEILPADSYTLVNSFNNRTGDVNPAAHDYEAEQVDFDNTGTGIAANNVRGAIIEVKGSIPAGPVVDSFNGRTGAVTPADHDYNARQIDYDNSVSGITASDVQTAIDKIVTMIFASGVASFNGRVGVVLPAAHDYDGSMIDYDNTLSGLTADNVQDAIDELAGGGSVTITLTLNGAKEDTILVEDSNGVTIGTCVFAAGQTSGTITASVPSGYSDTWTFTSSVAKDPADGTSDYTKTAAIDDTASQTVNVYPDYFPLWFGNFIDCSICEPASGQFNIGTTPSYVTIGTNEISGNVPNNKGLWIIGNNAYNMSQFSKLCVIGENSAGVSLQIAMFADLINYSTNDDEVITTSAFANAFTGTQTRTSTKYPMIIYWNGTGSTHFESMKAFGFIV